MQTLFFVLIFSPAYFYCNWQSFRYVESQTEQKIGKWKSFGLTFLINYVLFLTCSFLQFHLIVNWAFFAAFLIAEIALLYRCGLGRSFFYGMTCTLVGLSINIFFRALMAIAFQVPASSFDGKNTQNGYLKALPIALAFLLAGLVLQAIQKTAWTERMKVISADSSNLKFLSRLMAAMYCYLFLNLLIYYMPGDDLVFKLWVMKSCVSVLTGYYIAALYAYRMSRLNSYREQNRVAQQEMLARKREEEELHALAYTDPLTGCYNRKFINHKLEELMEKKESFCLCFVDLDGLKGVNDQLGHQMGDSYIIAVAQALETVCRGKSDIICRYGGDEFLLVLGCGVQAAEDAICAVQRILMGKANSEEYPFSLSISCGVAASGGYSSVKELIVAADAKMYENKHKQG